MTNDDNDGSDERYAERVPVGRCTLLECAVGPERGGNRSIIISLGHDNGAIDRVAMSGAEARSWVARIANLLRDSGPPLRVRYGSREWFSRHNVLRAAASVAHDVPAAAERTRRSLPDVWEFVEAELATVERLLNRSGRTAAKPETVAERLRHAMLVLIEAMRRDR